MSNTNLWLADGNLTADAELRFMPSGTAVLNFRLAVNDSWTDRNTNEKKEKTLFADVAYFAKNAETLKGWLTRGRHIFVEGKWEQREWNDKATNAKRVGYSVRANRVQFLDRPPEQAAQPEAEAAAPASNDDGEGLPF